MKRKHLWTPHWAGAIEGWTINFVIRNKWRTEPEHDFDDLYQDGYIYFIICKDRYPDVVDPQHFMRLYQTCLRNHLHTLSTSRTEDFTKRGGLVSELMESQKSLSLQKELDLLLEDAPEALKSLLDGTTYLGFLQDWETGWRECSDSRLRRILGEHLNEVLTWLEQQGVVPSKI